MGNGPGVPAGGADTWYLAVKLEREVQKTAKGHKDAKSYPCPTGDAA